MKWVIASVLLALFTNMAAQNKILPTHDATPYLYESVDSIAANTYMDKSTIDMAVKFELITYTRRAFSAVVVHNGSAAEYPLVKPNSNHRIQLEDMEAFDVNMDGFYDLIITLNHLQGHSLGDATYQETVISKYVLDTVNSTLLLKDTTSIERISTLLLGESPDPVPQTSTCSCPIHVFEGKIVFTPCSGNGCEVPGKEEEEFIWNGTAFMLKEN